MQTNEVRMVRWLADKDEGKMIFQAPRQYSLFLHLALCSSADLLINVTHGWHTAAGAAPWAHDANTEHPHPSQQLAFGWLPPSLRKTIHGSTPQRALPQDLFPCVSCPLL